MPPSRVTRGTAAERCSGEDGGEAVHTERVLVGATGLEREDACATVYLTVQRAGPTGNPKRRTETARKGKR